MLNNLGLGFVFTAKDLATRQMERLGRGFESFERRAAKSLTRTQVALRQFAIGAGIAMAGIAGIGGSLALANEAGEFEQQMARVAAITNIATDSADALNLEATALNAALSTRFSPTEAAEGLQNFASQGFDAKQQTEALVPALRLAQAGMISVSDSASAMTSAIKVFGLEADDAGIVTDKLLKITTKTSLQSEDLALALGTVGRGAGIAHQNLDEMLIAMGLVKNTGVEASVAASSVSSALIFMSKNAKEFKKVGVDITDASGQFRDMTDVIIETREAFGKKYTDQAEAAAKASDFFGRFGLTAFQAVGSQLEKFKDASGNILPAREAIALLRKEMADAAGTAEVFEAKILDTFEGQKKILEGVMQGLAVVLGKPFARAFKPIVTGIKNGVEAVIVFIQSIPEPVLDVLSKIFVGLSGLAVAIGTLVALKGAITLIGAAMGFLGISLGTVVTPLLVIVGVLGVASLALAAFKVNAEQTGGGVASFFTDKLGKIKLFFQGLLQIFKDGALSGPVLDELNKAENEGVKEFLGTIVDFGARIMNFFDGVGTGFSDLMREARPVFDEFRVALAGIGESMGFFTNDIENAAGTPMESFKNQGMAMGRVLGQAALLIVRALTLIITVVGGVLTALDMMGLSIGDVVKVWLWYKGILIAVNAVKALSIARTTMLAAAQTRLGGVTALVGGKMAAFRGGLASLNTRLLALTKGSLLGQAGLVVAAGAAGYAFGSWLDDTFKLSDGIDNLIGKITGLNEKLEEHNRLAGGLTKRAAGAKQGVTERVQAIAAQRGMSVQEWQQTRLKELENEGFIGEVNAKTGGIDIVGKVGQAPAADRASAQPAAAVSASPVAAAMADSEGSLDSFSRELAKADKETAAAIAALGKRPIEARIFIGDEEIAARVESGARSNRSRAFQPMTAEG